ncbi:MAG TPA: nitrilase-related carbon-nitrogen hydrolase [Candidatus Paceibacterota bacterium]|nr:nitrilase-related carbon-nitrogen hydrolase [Candidatus Paceibacterota bacterium]
MHLLPIVLVITASALGASALAIPALWFLAPLALTLFFYVLWRRTGSYQEALLYGFVFGIITASAGVVWFWDAFPLDWMNIESRHIQWGVLATTWGIVSLSLSLGPALAALGIWKMRENTFAAIVAALFWVLAEEGRMWGYALLTWGAQSLMGAHFSMAALGYALTENPYLLQIAAFGGLAPLNAAVGFMGAGLALSVYALATRRVTTPALIGSFVLCVVLALPLVAPQEISSRPEPLRVALITTSFPIEDAEKAPETLRVLLGDAAARSPDIVVMPEGFGVRKAYPDEPERQEALSRLFGATERLILSADTVQDEYSMRVRLFYDSTTEGELERYDKMFLIPLGEYSPYFASVLYAPFQDKGVESHLSKVQNRLERGDGVTTARYHGEIVGALLCSDSLSPSLYRAQAREGATLLANLSNAAWFRGSHLVHARLVQLGRVHAVANRAYFVQAGNLSPSFALAPDGRIVAESAWGTESVLTVEIPSSP